MEEIRLSRTYTSEEQKQYLRIPFEVGENIERIEISYAYLRHKQRQTPYGEEKREINIIDLGLFDEQGQLCGWSGSERLSVVVSEHRSTPGYRRLPIRSGTWQVALGIYKVETSVEVQLTIRLVPKQRRWLKGDLHMHTLNSDGIYTTGEVIAYAKHAKLDFIALTDHNNTEQNKEIGNPDDITVIAGMEYTNYGGHANFFFTDDGIFTANPLSNSTEEMQATIAEAKRRNAIVSLNHICDVGCPWVLGFDIPYDLIEVWNGFIKPSDMQAIAWWHQRLAEGRHLAAVGGSDTHRIEQGRSHGTPTTYVHALSCAPMDILDALVEGRSFITATADGARLDLHLGSSGLGETSTWNDGLEGEASVDGAKQGDRLILFSDQGVEASWNAEYDGSLTFAFLVEKRRFYRIELYRKTLGIELLAALTNPVYLS